MYICCKIIIDILTDIHHRRAVCSKQFPLLPQLVPNSSKFFFHQVAPRAMFLWVNVLRSGMSCRLTKWLTNGGSPTMLLDDWTSVHVKIPQESMGPMGPMAPSRWIWWELRRKTILVWKNMYTYKYLYEHIILSVRAHYIHMYLGTWSFAPSFCWASPKLRSQRFHGISSCVGSTKQGCSACGAENQVHIVIYRYLKG